MMRRGEFGDAGHGRQFGAPIRYRLHRREHRALAGQRDEEIDLAERLCPRLATGDPLLQQAHRLGAGGTHVDVRVGAKRHHGIAAVDHRLGEVAVRINADGERNVADDGADTAQQFAFHVREAIGHRGPVQVEIDAVERAGIEGAGQLCADQAGDALERLVLHGAGRAGEAPGQRHQSGIASDLDGAGDRHRGGAHRIEQASAHHQRREAAALHKIDIAGGTRGEGMALVQKAANGDAHEMSLIAALMGPIVECPAFCRPTEAPVGPRACLLLFARKPA